MAYSTKRRCCQHHGSTTASPRVGRSQHDNNMVAAITCCKSRPPRLFHGRLKQEVEVKQHSFGLLQRRISGSESAQLADAVAATQQELEQAKAAVDAAQQKKTDMIKAAKVWQCLT